MMLLVAGAGGWASANAILSLSWWPERVLVLVACAAVGLGAQWIVDTTEFKTSILSKGAHYAAYAAMALNTLIILGWFFALAMDANSDAAEPSACYRFCD